MTLGPPPTLGFYGKVATHGDFVSRRLPRAFVDPWDRWLQECLQCSRDQLGERWLDVYLTSPVWRFVLAAGVCGNSGWVGVVIPGVDRVGRYFPLTVTAPLPASANTLRVLLGSEAWFARLERLTLSSLDDGFDLDRFDREVQSLAAAPLDAPSARPSAEGREASAWRFPVGTGPGGSETAWVPLASGLLEAFLPQHSLWWTAGSDRVHPSLGVCSRLPPARCYAALMDGEWESWGWRSHADLPPRLDSPSVPPPPTPATDAGLVWRSAHCTHTGHLRSHNEDACIDLPERQIWAVADGMGGHAEGDVASAEVAQALQGLAELATLDDLVAAAREALARVNTSLRHRAMARPLTDVIGSTVVALLARGNQAACLWAGDSRAYLLRGGRLLALTHDHNVLEELRKQGGLGLADPAAVQSANALTRAVGGADSLELDEVRVQVQPEDRFLLCSDGLTREVPDIEIGEALAKPTPDAVCETLIERALASGGHDNVTVAVLRAAR